MELNCPMTSGPKPGLQTKVQLFGRALHSVEAHFHELRTLALIKYFSSDCIEI